MASSIAGIDIGSTNVKIAVDKSDAPQLAVERLPENMVADGRIVSADMMSQFLRDMKRKYHIAASNAALVLPANSAFFRRVTMPYMTIGQLELNLPYEFKDFLSEDSDKYFYDYAVASTNYAEDGTPETLELLAAAVLKSTIEDYTKILRKSGFKLRRALPHEMAYADLLALYIEREPLAAREEFCIIDIGSHHTSVDIYAGSSYVASKVIDVGCSDINRAIANIKNIDEFVAGTYRENNTDEVLADPACVEVYSQIAVEVVKVINFYNFNNPDNALADMYFCGIGSSIIQLVAAIDDQTELVSHPIDDIMPKRASGTPNLATCSLAYAMSLEA